MASALIGGTTSKIAGGKFANGAITAVMVFGLNDQMSNRKAQNARSNKQRSPGGPQLSANPSAVKIESKNVRFTEGGELIIDNTFEAYDHYRNGDGSSAVLGKRSQYTLINSSRHQAALDNIKSGITDLSGNYGVDLTWDDYTYHIGDTAIHYSTACERGTCTTTFTGFVEANKSTITGNDGFKRIFDNNFEFGTPYNYQPFIWKETFPNPGYSE